MGCAAFIRQQFFIHASFCTKFNHGMSIDKDRSIESKAYINMSLPLKEKAKMNVKLGVKQRIIGIISLTVLLVGTVGVFTYLQFSEVLDTITSTSKTDPSISKTKEVLSNISRAENRIRSYTLTKDSIHLSKYAEMKDQMDLLLSDLKEMKPIIAGTISIDTFQSLVAERFSILEELVGIQNEFRVEAALESVQARVIEGKKNPQATETAPEKRWFNLKKKPSTKPVTASTLTEINANIEEVRVQETRKEEAQLQRELELLNAERTNDLRVQSVLTAIEIDEKKTNLAKSREVKALIRRTNFQIILFCAAICGLLIFMTSTIVNYIRRNNEYRKILKRAKSDAESLAKAKEIFVATLSHEIRTPVNIISGFTEQLERSTLNQEQREHIHIISKTSSHLLDLINAVLDFTKLENNKLVLESTGFSLPKTISSVNSLLMSQAKSGEVALSFTLAPSVPSILIGDAFRMRQILINLVGNALKFSPGGIVEVLINSHSTNKENCILALEITDNGIGMTPEQLDLVFNEFEQAEKSTTRLYGGTGLGLSITKKLVELQGGTIQLESTKGEGTRVFVEIPFELGDETDLGEVPTSFDQIDLSPFTILVVDDEPFNRKLVRTILTKYNAQIIEAEDGQEAIAIAQESQPDLILMDEQMPNLNGIESAKLMRELMITAPIIALSAAVTTDYLEALSNSVIDDSLSKPFRQSELLQKIVTHLLPNTTTPLQEDPEVNFDDLKSLSDGDRVFYLDMLETFETSTSNGIISIQTAIKQENWNEAAEFAHRISAPCKHLSADTLYNYLKEIETNCREKIHLAGIHELVDVTSREAERILSHIREERLSCKE